VSADLEQRKLAAIMFTDMVGYSALSQRDDKLALELLEEHRRLIREIFPRFHGTEIKTIGDAFLIEFNSALEAAQCAIEIQRALGHRNHDVPAERRIELKIGVHIGDVVHRGGDVYGDGVNIASRIEPLAGAGGICVSMDVERQIRNALEARFEKLGPTELKNISVAMDLFRIVLPWEQRKSEIRSGHAPKSGIEGGPATSARFPWHEIVIGVLLVAALIGGALLWFHRPGPGGKGASENPATATSSVPEKSVAVLPFENLSEDKQNAFFADGVQDEILTNLAKVADLKVISRTSVMQYKATAARNLREIGQALGVAHVLEGSVQRAGNKVRVNAQLIDARNDAHLWAQTYTRDLADVFGIQSEIAEAIAQQLQAHLTATEKAEIAKPSTTDPVAYDLYLRARQLDDLFNDPDAKGSLLQGISLLEEAVRRDPKFLRAYCLMCETHLDLYWGGADHTDQRRELARIALQRAEEIQPNAGEVHWMKGIYAYHGFRDYDRALQELELAKQLLPNEARVYVNIGAVDRRTERWKEAEANFTRAAELDPRNFIVLMEAGSIFAGLRRGAEARHYHEQALAILPNDPFARTLLGYDLFGDSGDISALRKQLDLVAQQGSEAARGVAFPLLICSWMARDRNLAEKAIAFVPADGIANSFDEALVPRDYCVGRTAWLFGNKQLAQTALTAARAIFEHTTREQPDYSQAWAYLGLTDAMLGRCDDAIQEGKRACEILPIKKDSWVGPTWITYLAMIYTTCGQKDAALEQLEMSARLPVGIIYGDLKCNPDWDPLRGDPRFEKIVASLAPKPEGQGSSGR
jgi:TolB-like protein/class 3 adenylate cyclase/Tfp pilus assembly protein PilF